MKPIVIALPGEEGLANALVEGLAGEIGGAEFASFPDGETYIRVKCPVLERRVIIAASLARPNSKFLPLMFAAQTVKDLGAAQVGLATPYLSYMRQDRRFKKGEGVTSAYFASALSQSFDWLATVDPHLHRRKSLSEIYSIPAVAAHAAPLISNWIRDYVDNPLLIGPDEESKQWASAVAANASAPFIILRKTRRGPQDVEVSVPEVESWRGHTPVLVDDIISTARTMIETIEHLKRAKMRPPVCIGVHAVFASDAFSKLQAAGVERIATCNTITHPSNAIDVIPLMTQAIGALLK